MKVKPTGSVEYCCIVKSALLHSRPTRPKSAFSSVPTKYDESRTPSRVSFAWTSSSQRDTPDLLIDGQVEHDGDSESGSEQDVVIEDMETNLQPEQQPLSDPLDSVPEEQEDMVQTSEKQATIVVEDEVTAQWADKQEIDLHEMEDESSEEEDGLTVDDFILEDIDGTEDQEGTVVLDDDVDDDMDGASVDVLEDEEQRVKTVETVESQQ